MDLESASHVLTLTMIIIIKFEVDMTIHCRVIAFLLKIRYMTLWPWSLTFWPWTVVIHGLSCDQPCHRVRRSYANYNHYNYRNWVITSSTDTNENVFVCGHCSCAHLPIQYTTFIMLWWWLRVMYSRAANVSRFQAKNSKCHWNGAPNGSFWGKWGSKC